MGRGLWGGAGVCGPVGDSERLQGGVIGGAVGYGGLSCE